MIIRVRGNLLRNLSYKKFLIFIIIFLPLILFPIFIYSQSVITGYIQVVSPNGGEIWKAGTVHNIICQGQLINSSGVVYYGSWRIELWKENYKYMDIISGIILVGPGTVMISFNYPWLIPSSIPTDNDYRIKVILYIETLPPIYDFSDGYFTIFKHFDVISPNGSEMWNRGRVYEIKWLSDIPSSPTVKLELYKGSSFKIPIISSTPNNGSYNWLIPETLEIGNDYKVKIILNGYPEIDDFGDLNFEIIDGLPPEIEIYGVNAWWENEIDIDCDGYRSSATLCVSGYLKNNSSSSVAIIHSIGLWYKEAGSNEWKEFCGGVWGIIIPPNANFPFNEKQTISGLSHNLYDWVREIVVGFRWGPWDDPDLNDYPMELLSEESTNVVDYMFYN